VYNSASFDLKEVISMALIRWNPWSLSSLLEEDLDLPTMPGLSRLGQGLNIYETEDSLIAEVALPGIQEDQIDVTIDDGVVRITASTTQKEEDKQNRRYFMNSISSSYNYSFRLPEGLVTSLEPKAELESGVLTLAFAKVEKKAPTKVKVLAKKAATQTDKES
jgi:HSP20 family protein